ncbi:uncharacterized protein G2W53_040858 [Senna tora]|uniref:Uncharacterized protein n=1 Tax=Senna tora TaxID=362788 RepID=A0A834SE88_9FABA|nr:uncharacterized protein G2W53_040858 [Senna tora]
MGKTLPLMSVPMVAPSSPTPIHSTNSSMKILADTSVQSPGATEAVVGWIANGLRTWGLQHVSNKSCITFDHHLLGSNLVYKPLSIPHKPTYRASSVMANSSVNIQLDEPTWRLLPLKTLEGKILLLGSESCQVPFI